LSHPNIVTVHDFGEAGGHCYLVMEFVDGLNLRQLLLTTKMTPEQALTIVPKICEALQYAHEQGVVHRDIKPENILVDKSGRVKIADFGIAKIVGSDRREEPLTGEQQSIGTPHYMAPEQVEKPATVDHRADIYSLGVVFYEMLTGELPLGKFAAPSSKVQVDVRLDEVVLHALEKEPERRYQHASQVKSDVETIATTPPLLGAGMSAGAPPSGPSHSTAGHVPAGPSHPPVDPGNSKVLGYIALGLMLAGLLGSPLVLAVTWRLESVLLFGGVALALALVVGIIGWQGRLGKGVAIASMIMLFSGGVLAVPLAIFAWLAHARSSAHTVAVAQAQDAMTRMELSLEESKRTTEMQSAAVYRTAPVVRGGISQTVTADGTLSNLTNESTAWRISAVVSEADIALVQSGQEAAFTLDAFQGRTFGGVVRQIRNTPIRANGEVSYETWIDVTTSESGFRPGMTAHCSLIVAHRDNVLKIPNAALRYSPPNTASLNIRGSRKSVYIIRSTPTSMPLRRLLTTGITDGISTEVQSGLYEGDLVITGSDTGQGSSVGGSAANGSTQQAENEVETNAPARVAVMEVLKVKIRQLEEEAARKDQLYRNGMLPRAELQSATDEIEVLKAQLSGDAVEVARARLAAAQHQLDPLEAQYRNGVVSISDYQVAKNAVELRQAELRAAEARLAQPDPGKVAARKKSLEARLSAALAIMGMTERDSAMAALARDAAAAGEADLARSALQRISSMSARDEAVKDASLSLATQKRLPDALSLASTMQGMNERDTTLAGIASCAAAARDATTARSAVQRMSGMTARDDAAYEGAKQLTKLGMRSEALDLARLISSMSKRDQAMSELAR
jgi:Protein kinase domain/HlyD family secretion protein